jgi:hypothetical protein
LRLEPVDYPGKQAIRVHAVVVRERDEPTRDQRKSVVPSARQAAIAAGVMQRKKVLKLTQYARYYGTIGVLVDDNYVRDKRHLWNKRLQKRTELVRALPECCNDQRNLKHDSELSSAVACKRDSEESEIAPFQLRMREDTVACFAQRTTEPHLKNSGPQPESHRSTPVLAG